MSVKAAILGAGGTIGPPIARDLAGSEEVSELRLLDVDAAAAERVAGEIGNGNVTAARADALADPDGGDSLARALDDIDVLINSASYRVNIEVMQACLDAGCHYMDLGGLYWKTSEQMQRFGDGSDVFADAGLLAVLGIGSSPGKTNLMAVRAEREIGPLEAIDVSAAGRDMEPPPGFAIPYALRTLIDELTLPPVVVRDGRAVEIDALADGGEVDFGDPIGVAATINTLHSEMLTFPRNFGCREGSFRLSLAPAVLERLRELAGGSEEEIASAQRETVPASSETVSVHLIEARSGNRGARVRCVTSAVPGLGGGSVVSTAAPAAALTRLIARDQVQTRGVHPPERCIEPDELFAELEQRGSVFDFEEAGRA